MRRLRLAAPIRHATLHTLSIAHVDRAAFFATVEKRGRPDLADRPVLSVEAGVASCSPAATWRDPWVSRSAKPMLKALAACPDGEVMRPDMAKYNEVGRAVRAEMPRLTPSSNCVD